ncbi:MAG: hypothetical protein ACXW6T_19435, partial [Candidatus Binatia bacterium]
MRGVFLEESARLQAEAKKLGTPIFMERAAAEKIAKRTFKRTSVERAWDHFAVQCVGYSACPDATLSDRNKILLAGLIKCAFLRIKIE